MAISVFGNHERMLFSSVAKNILRLTRPGGENCPILNTFAQRSMQNYVVLLSTYKKIMMGISSGTSTGWHFIDCVQIELEFRNVRF